MRMRMSGKLLASTKSLSETSWAMTLLMTFTDSAMILCTRALRWETRGPVSLVLDSGVENVLVARMFGAFLLLNQHWLTDYEKGAKVEEGEGWST
jgi:hypothetical protein